jgi:hypothetical protein
MKAVPLRRVVILLSVLPAGLHGLWTCFGRHKSNIRCMYACLNLVTGKLTAYMQDASEDTQIMRFRRRFTWKRKTELDIVGYSPTEQIRHAESRGWSVGIGVKAIAVWRIYGLTSELVFLPRCMRDSLSFLRAGPGHSKARKMMVAPLRAMSICFNVAYELAGSCQ